MKTGNEVSFLEVFLKGLMEIWSAGGEALRLQKDLNVRSLEETSAAAERVGCTVCYVDLPKKVSGFAEIIEGKPHIVLNRAKSRKNLEYTLPHELGHHVLHLNPSPDNGQSGLRNMDTAEFQANLFAVTWIMWLGNKRQKKEVLENPESSATVATCVLATVLLAVTMLFAHVCLKLFSLQRTALPETK